MRFLILFAILGYAAPAPEPQVPVPVPVDPIAPVARLTPKQPTISSGDINGAAIDAQVEAADYVQTVVDKDRQIQDHVAEITNEQAWRAVDNVKTIEAIEDGAAARVAPVLAKQIVRENGIAPVVPRRIAPAPVAPVAPAPVAQVAAAAPVPQIVPAPLEYSAQFAYDDSPVSASYAAPVYSAPPGLEFYQDQFYPSYFDGQLPYVF